VNAIAVVYWFVAYIFVLGFFRKGMERVGPESLLDYIGFGVGILFAGLCWPLIVVAWIID
jgi:hypothetical protein